MKDFAKSIYVGNAKACNAEVVKDGGKWVVLYAEGTKSKEFDSKDEADKFAKEVGNSVAADITTDGNIWIVTTSDGKKKEFPSEREAEAYVKKIKTGNIKNDAKAKDLYKKMMDAKEIAEEWGRASNYQKKDNLEGGRKAAEDEYRKAKKAYEDYAMNKKNGNEEKTGAEEFFKKLSDDVKEREKKDDADIEKVGNREVYVNQSEQTKAVVYEDGTIMLWDKNGNNYKKIKAGSLEEARKKLNSDYKKVGNKKLKFTDKQDGLKEFVYDEENDKGYIYYDGKLVDTIPHAGQGWLNLIKQKAFSSGVMNKVGNKVGNKNLNWDTGTIDWDVGNFNGQWYVTKNGQKLVGPFMSMKEAERYLDGHKWELQDKYGNAKTGNARYTTREDVISHLDTDLYDICKKVPAGSPSYAYVSELQKKGWDISTISKYSKEIGKIIDQYKVGNSKTGNVQYHKVGKITIRLEANDDDWTVYDINGHELKSGKGGLGRAKTWAEHFARFTNKRTGNEASDDKFAYVMREFDEGKLKTPDGKVVTDPAQAKAIAYSESKKTENGLARARKAMNKGITMWKGNDSAYIKEDGTVSYLENNSFETDKDKFESQESAIKELSKQGYVKK